MNQILEVTLKYQWIDKDIDRNSIVKAIESFLQSKKFKIRREDSEDSYKILGILRTPEDEARSVLVTVSGTPNNLTVDLKTGDQTQSLLKHSSLISFFGGGSWLLKKQKSADFYQKLEEELWNYIESRVESKV